jgi:hypothetical protein
LIFIRQMRTPTTDLHEMMSEFSVGDAPVIEVTVHGQDGVWVETSLQGSHQTEEGG